MSYAIGDRVCLWKLERPFFPGTVGISKQVIVTITEIKTGVPGEFTRQSMEAQSLRGIGDDGQVYEKHWYTWPESQTSCYEDVWSLHVAPDGDSWIPLEAWYHSNRMQEQWRRQAPGPAEAFVTNDGQELVPQGDVTICEEHGLAVQKGFECFGCLQKLISNNKD